VIVNDPLDVRPIVEFASDALLMEPAGSVTVPVNVGLGIVNPLGSVVEDCKTPAAVFVTTPAVLNGTISTTPAATLNAVFVPALPEAVN
jgi:hypothetical protein